MNANELRRAFTSFFAARDHVIVPSSSLIPQHPRAPMFTNAGMNQFIPYFLEEEVPPHPRMTSVQKCVRIRGKHDDIELIGRTTRHLSFFEMLGNFSFGDYFKAEAIRFAWDLLTGDLGLDGDRLWATVYVDDDEAVELWRDEIGLPAERIQKMTDDNFWEMGETGPCGPCSEIYFDRGEGFGDGGGPAQGSEERFFEIWNLVFMQFDRQVDGSLKPLAKPCIDTGSGLERLQTIVSDVPSIWETDLVRPIIARAESLTGRPYGEDHETDVALRVLADHARSMSLLVSDGVLPSNENRGYVLRRIIRRAVLAARRLGVEVPVTVALADSVAEVLGEGYPKVRSDLDLVQGVLEREESGFDRTLRTGLALLDEAVHKAKASAQPVIAGDAAFKLHDTHGFPIDLTEELAREAGVGVDRVGFDAEMEGQRARAREAARTPGVADEEAYRAILEDAGPTEFVGRAPTSYAASTKIVGVLAGSEPGTAEIFLEATPFYAEGGGQVGDKGTIVTETGRARVYDTVPAIAGLTVHRAKVHGELFAGQDALATIDAFRREATRRNHTGTHLLHSALRSVLGDHVRQQSSYVAPDRLRFDFSHHSAPSREEMDAVLQMANADVLTDDPVETTETSRAEAETMGALAFFGDKYGDVVRVVRAGPHSLEFCGGTHVHSLGQIGPIAVISEGSIGANTRRIEALTGVATITRSQEREALISQASELLKTEPEGLIEALERVLERQRATDKELQGLRRGALDGEANDLATTAKDGIVVARRDDRSPDDLRALAQAITKRDGVRVAVVGGAVDGAKVAIAAATGGSPHAGELVKRLAATVGGGGGGSPEVAVAGGRDPSRLDTALDEARQILADG